MKYKLKITANDYLEEVITIKLAAMTTELIEALLIPIDFHSHEEEALVKIKNVGILNSLFIECLEGYQKKYMQELFIFAREGKVYEHKDESDDQVH